MKKNPSPSQKNYQKLLEISKETQILQGILSLLNWDQETYMPKGSHAIRSQQLETLAGIEHKGKVSRKFKNALAKLIDLKTGEIIPQDLTENEIAALKEWRKDYIKHTALPTSFVKEFTKVSSQATNAWRIAKKENSFLQFAPFLDRIVSLNRKKAELLGYEGHPYNALLNEYEPEITTVEIDSLFNQLKSALTPMVKEFSQKKVDDSFLDGEWDIAKQMEISHRILDEMGYDLNKGRVDFSSHPFSSSSHPTDSRITTRIHPTNLMSNIFVILHEGGHSLYEMGLPEEHYGSPLGQYKSLGIHESQSRWWETRIGMSKPFWKHFFPILQETFKPKLNHVTLEQLYKAINKVQPSFIRVEADELTYPLHVILRFEMEKGLIEGALSVRDIPGVWNHKMQEYLGITPKNNSEGCLQDIHWAMGAFGYFPTYSLGNLYAAHLFERFAKDHPNWQEEIAKGHFKFINQWLEGKIYQHGRRYSTRDLLLNATGKIFSADAYLNYLKNKYQNVYS